jgi:hypothetical protein
LHEVACTHPGELRIELEEHHPLDAAVLDRRQLFTQPRESRGRRLGREELHRLRLEGNDGRRQTELASARQQPLEDGPMSQVDTVEVADGRNATSVGRAQVV